MAAGFCSLPYLHAFTLLVATKFSISVAVALSALEASLTLSVPKLKTERLSWSGCASNRGTRELLRHSGPYATL